jgi:hypothetical protein
MARFSARRVRIASLFAALLIPTVWAACDDTGVDLDDDDDDDATAVLTAVVHDSADVLPPTRTEPAPADSFAYNGSLTGTAQIEIFSDAEGWLPVGEPTEVTFEIYCEEAAIVEGDLAMPTGTYSQVRLTLTDFQADVAAGAVITGQTVANGFVVTFGDGIPLVIEKAVTPFMLAAGEATTILFDLNTELWLDPEVILAGNAPAAEVQNATNVIIR